MKNCCHIRFDQLFTRIVESQFYLSEISLCAAGVASQTNSHSFYLYFKHLMNNSSRLLSFAEICIIFQSIDSVQFILSRAEKRRNKNFS